MTLVLPVPAQRSFDAEGEEWYAFAVVARLDCRSSIVEVSKATRKTGVAAGPVADLIQVS